MKDLPRVLLIVANAGSGKTYRLVTRCLELIAREQPPDKILALTFTRKAAAEFLQQLFARLAAAASDPAKLARLRADLDDPGLDRPQCLHWLRLLAATLPRLAMGTMDQFFGRIVRAFPFELGLPREFRLTDQAAQEENRRRTLDRLFAAAADTPETFAQFVELLRQESRNRAGQSVLRTLSSAAAGLQESYLATPPDIVWGDPDTIWPQGAIILMAPSVAAAAEDLWREIETTHPQLGPGAHAQWRAWLDLAIAHRPPRRMPEALYKFVSSKLSGHSEDSKSGEAYIPVGRKTADRLYLRGRVEELRTALRHALIKLELEAKMSASRALHALLARYESVYDATVRESGDLTFADIAMFLAAQTDAPWRRDLDYRLDGRHDHWLLDEFQDTSRTQWRILEPLADEIIQDSSSARSFFYVGDTKQAIYGWRGGDARLFWEIRDRYNGGRERVVLEDKLEISRRSDRAIVRAVETALHPDVLRAQAAAFRFPEPTLDAWQQAWVEHQPAPGAAEGYARFELVDTSDEDETKDDALAREVLHLLREVEPLERGLDCAILVRTNDELARYVGLLKSAGIPAAAEGKMNPCTATPAGLLLLSLARFVASPGDVIAGKHVEFSPLRVLCADGMDTLRRLLQEDAASLGFAAAFRRAIDRAAGAVPPGEAAAFLEAAADYNNLRRGAGDWLGLVHFITHRRLEENETPGAIRVMTVHQAKGLGVDMVILPELGGKALSEFSESSGISLHRDSAGRVQWGLALPRKDFCEADPVLHQAREDIRASQAYEALCVLYVAMTRAKKALYCVAARGRNDKNAGNLLERTFPPADTDSPRREQGDPQWFAAHAKIGVGVSGDQLSTPDFLPLPIRGPLLQAQAPSRRRPPRLATIIEGADARELGTEVHRLLAKIEWIDEPPPATPTAGAAADLVSRFLDGQDGKKIFARPSGEFLLWREQTFDLVLDHEHLTGTFDRVLITKQNGRPHSALTYDFKTENGTPEELTRRYAEQLQLYRRAAAQLLAIPPDQVAAIAISVLTS